MRAWGFEGFEGLRVWGLTVLWNNTWNIGVAQTTPAIPITKPLQCCYMVTIFVYWWTASFLFLLWFFVMSIATLLLTTAECYLLHIYCIRILDREKNQLLFSPIQHLEPDCHCAFIFFNIQKYHQLWYSWREKVSLLLDGSLVFKNSELFHLGNCDSDFFSSSKKICSIGWQKTFLLSCRKSWQNLPKVVVVKGLLFLWPKGIL